MGPLTSNNHMNALTKVSGNHWSTYSFDNQNGATVIDRISEVRSWKDILDMLNLLRCKYLCSNASEFQSLTDCYHW